MKIRHVVLGVLAIPALGLLAVAGFIAWGNRPGPRDLRLESITVVDRLSAEVDDDSLTSPKKTRLSRTVLRLDLSTRAALGKRAVGETMNLWSDVLDCGEAKSARDYFAWGPYFGRSPMPGRLRREGEAALLEAERRADRHVYSLYLPVEGVAGTAEDFNADLPYDLRELKEPLCVRLGGGSMAFMAFRTNVVRIPREQVLQALAQSPE